MQFAEKRGLVRWIIIAASFLMYRGWLYDLPADARITRESEPDPGTRDAWGTTFAASWQFLPELSATVGSSTFSLQRTPESTLQSPAFNLHTNLFVDLGLDVEALLKRI